MGRSSPRTITTKGRANAGTRPRYRGQGRGGLVAPILVLPMRRGTRYERPHALCERHRALLEHGCVLGPSAALIARVAGRGLLVRMQGLMHRRVHRNRELLLCAPGGTVRGRASRSGAPV